jgi:hypothetical protein
MHCHRYCFTLAVSFSVNCKQLGWPVRETRHMIKYKMITFLIAFHLLYHRQSSSRHVFWIVYGFTIAFPSTLIWPERLLDVLATQLFGNLIKFCKAIYIIRILQHFATKLWNIANFVILFQAVMKILSRPKKKICGFPVSSYKNLGRVGRAAKSHGLPVSLQVFGLTSRSHGWSWKSHGFSQKYN